VKPWKTLGLVLEAFDAILLQFGHGGEAVEDNGTPRNLVVQTTLQFGHGGEAVEDWAMADSLNANAALQFGHGGEAVEDGVNSAPTTDAIAVLQFGHGGEAVEDMNSLKQGTTERGASIRPRR